MIMDEIYYKSPRYSMFISLWTFFFVATIIQKTLVQGSMHTIGL